MKLHSVFLRNACILPDRFDLRQEPFCENWMLADGALSPDLDVKIRSRGWHFVWLEGAIAGWGLGRSEEGAMAKALVNALKRVNGRFNAAELDLIHILKCPGFQLANVTLSARQIQKQTSLDCLEEKHLGHALTI